MKELLQRFCPEDYKIFAQRDLAQNDTGVDEDVDEK